MKRLPREFLPVVIGGTAGKFFGLHFVKKDGSLREINGHLQEDQSVSPDKDGYLTIWDRNSQGYRKAHIAKIKEFSFLGNTYKIV